MKIVLGAVACMVLAVTVGASQPSSFASEWNPFLPVQSKVEALNSTSVFESYILQRVDNFDTNNLNTYHQRFLSYGEHHQSGGPLFVLLGGFLSVSEERLVSSMPYGLARDMNGSVFYLEHRYYGNSIPVK